VEEGIDAVIVDKVAAFQKGLTIDGMRTSLA
jgi:hypothetical protein